MNKEEAALLGGGNERNGEKNLEENSMLLLDLKELYPTYDEFNHALVDCLEPSLKRPGNDITADDVAGILSADYIKICADVDQASSTSKGVPKQMEEALKGILEKLQVTASDFYSGKLQLIDERGRLLRNFLPIKK